MFLPYLITGVLIGLALSLSSQVEGQVTVEVSSAYSAIHYVKALSLPPGELEVVDLLPTPYRGSYRAAVRTRGGSIRLLALDGRDVQRRNPNPTLLVNRILEGDMWIELPQIPPEAGVTVGFRNDNRNPVQLRVTIFRVGTRPEHSVTRIRELLEIPVKSLEAFYVVPKFTITARPCGTVNAYSMPDITVCTELLADLFEKQASGAVIPILLHEMGHSLLYLWGLPGYNNEDMADEFAAVFLAKESPELLDDLIKWLESQDSATEGLIQLLNGGRHSISIQRARNIRAALLEPDKLLARWGRLLGPFRRQPYR